MRYAFGRGSQALMDGVKPELVAVLERALAYGIRDLTIIGPYGGLRTEQIQRKLVSRGSSKTMNSRHRIQGDGYGHALDAGPYPLDWNDIEGFIHVAHLVRFAAKELGVIVTWGCVWDRRLNDLGPNLEDEVAAYVQRRRAMGKKTFLDYPHFQFEGMVS